MSQDNLEDKIRDSFGSMSESEHAEAMARKEAVWKSVAPQENKKSKRYLLLLLLIGPLFFAGGWFLNKLSTPTATPAKVDSQETPALASPMQAKVMVQLEAKLAERKKEIDSLLASNNALSSLAANRVATPLVKTITEILTITDTIYLKEVKIEQQLVEKIIRDTVLIEVPVSMELEPAMVDLQDDLSEETPKKKNAKSQPVSIQFNFSEVDQFDK